MNRPKMVSFMPPKKMSELPVGPNFQCGHLIDVSSGMRSFRPIIDTEKCTKCMRCFLLCPDGAIDKSGDVMEIDYDYCKGCGICAHECALKAISIIKEADA